MVEPKAASAVAGQPWIDEVLVFPRNALAAKLRRYAVREALAEAITFVRTMRGRRFDLVVDFHAILRSAVLGRLSGAPQRVTYARPFGRELAYLFATHRARLSPLRMSRFERNTQLVRYLGVDRPAYPTPFDVAPAAVARMRAALSPGPSPVVIHPGTSDATTHKRYPAESYASVARSLAKEAGLPSIVTRGPARDDRALAIAIVDAAEGAARLAPETPTLGDLGALFVASRLYIGGDTGPMHVASLVGTPVVQLLGPTDPVENAPYPETPSRTIHSDGDAMDRIAPSEIVAGARELLEECGGQPAAGARV